MAYRSLVEVLAGVKHLPRYAAFLTSSSPSFRHSSDQNPDPDRCPCTLADAAEQWLRWRDADHDQRYRLETLG